MEKQPRTSTHPRNLTLNAIMILARTHGKIERAFKLPSWDMVLVSSCNGELMVYSQWEQATVNAHHHEREAHRYNAPTTVQ